MNLVNEIGSDVAQAFMVSNQLGKKLDASRAREIIAAIRKAGDESTKPWPDKTDAEQQNLQAAASSQ